MLAEVGATGLCRETLCRAQFQRPLQPWQPWLFSGWTELTRILQTHWQVSDMIQPSIWNCWQGATGTIPRVMSALTKLNSMYHWAYISKPGQRVTHLARLQVFSIQLTERQLATFAFKHYCTFYHICVSQQDEWDLASGILCHDQPFHILHIYQLHFWKYTARSSKYDTLTVHQIPEQPHVWDCAQPINSHRHQSHAPARK